MTYFEWIVVALICLNIGVIFYIIFAPMTAFKQGFISELTLEFLRKKKQ